MKNLSISSLIFIALLSVPGWPLEAHLSCSELLQVEPEVTKSVHFNKGNLSRQKQDIIQIETLHKIINTELQNIVEKTLQSGMQEQAFWTIQTHTKIYTVPLHLPMKASLEKFSVDPELSYTQLLDFIEISKIDPRDIIVIDFYHTHPFGFSPISKGDEVFIKQFGNYFYQDMEVRVSSSIYALDFGVPPTLYRLKNP